MKIKMRNRVAFWGLGELFRNEYARIMHWEQQGDIEIVAYIDKNGKPRKLDDITVLLPEEISTCGIQIDYIIVTTIAWNDVLQIAQKNGIPREKLVHPKIFSIPHFKISYYLSIRKSPLSLIAPDCIGGVLLHRIDLPFCSPFVNVRVGSSIWDYYGLLDRLPEYMNMSPSKEAKNMNRNIDWIGFEGRVDYPKLWYDDYVLHGFHYHSTEEMLIKWEERRKRYCDDRVVVLAYIYGEKDAERFADLKRKKIGFSWKKYPDKRIIEIPFDGTSKERYAYQFSTYVREMAGNGSLFEYVDLLDFFRTKDKDTFDE